VVAKPRHTIATVLAWLACLAAIVLAVIPPPAGVAPLTMHAAAVVVLAIGLWSTGAVPEYVTAMIFFLFAVLFHLAPPAVVFSGFYSVAAWMVFGGLVFGVAVQTTGLGTRIASALVQHFKGSYFGIIAGVVLVTGALAFVLPSATGRVMIMMPIIISLADKLGFGPGTRGRIGMCLALGTGTLYPTFAIMPAAVPNLVLLGAAESIYQVQFQYGEWLLLHFPVMGLLSFAALPFLIARLYPDTPRVVPDEGSPGRISAEQKRLMLYLGGALALWITDFWHHVSPSWVALGVAILCVLPRVGVMPATNLVQKVNFGPWLFVCGVIGMGAVVTQSGLGAVLGKFLFSVAPLVPGEDLRNFATTAAIGMGLGLVSGMPGQPAVMTPLAEQIVAGTGWPLVTALMTEATSWNMALFPYQLPPIVLTLALGGLRISQAMRLMVPFALFSWVVLLPLEFLWWRFLGYFG
jgi:anion transporter